MNNHMQHYPIQLPPLNQPCAQEFNGKTYYYLASPCQKYPTEQDLNYSLTQHYYPIVNHCEGWNYGQNNNYLANNANVSQPHVYENYYSPDVINNDLIQEMVNNGNLECIKCHRFYKNKNTLMTHLRTRHQLTESLCKEPGCNKVSYTINEYKKHMKIHEKERNRQLQERLLMNEAAAKKKKSPEKYSNAMLLNNFRQIEGMDMSLNQNSGKVMYTCQTCKKEFYHSHYAAKHTESHSSRQIKCYYCGETKAGDVDMRYHYLRCHKHEGIQAYGCSGCDTLFTEMRAYTAHKWKQSNDACNEAPMFEKLLFGELPSNVVVDQEAAKKLELLRKKHDEVFSTIAPVQIIHDPEVFGPTQSLIQTEMGLKTFEEVMKLSSGFQERCDRWYDPEYIFSDRDSSSSLSNAPQYAGFQEPHFMRNGSLSEMGSINSFSPHSNNYEYQWESPLNATLDSCGNQISVPEVSSTSRTPRSISGIINPNYDPNFPSYDVVSSNGDSDNICTSPKYDNFGSHFNLHQPLVCQPNESLVNNCEENNNTTINTNDDYNDNNGNNLNI